MPSPRENITSEGCLSLSPNNMALDEEIFIKEAYFKVGGGNAIKAIVCVLSYTELFFPPTEFLNNSRKGPGALIHIVEYNSRLFHISRILFH